MKLTDEQIAAIRDGTEVATPGPWVLSERSRHKQSIDGGAWSEFCRVVVRMEGDPDDEPAGLANAAHIARCDPDTIRALATEVLESRAVIAAKDARIAELAADASACRAALTNTFITVNEQADEIVKLTREPDEVISDASDDADISASLLEWADSIDADGDDLRPLLRRAAEALTDRLAQIKSAVDAAAKFAERNTALSARIAELEGMTIDVMASLAAAISLLERGGRKAAASDKMFAQMLVDYNASLARARKALGRDAT